MLDRKIMNVMAFAIASASNAQTPIWNNPCHPDDREAYAVAFSADGQKVLSASECDNARIRLWETSSGNMLWEDVMGLDLMCLVGIQFSANGTHFAVIEEMGNLLIYDYSGAVPVLTHTIAIGTDASFSLAFSPDNSKLVVDGTGGTLRVYDVTSGSLTMSIPGNAGTVYSVAYSPDGNLIAAGSQDNRVRLWNATDGSLVALLSGHTTDVRSVKFNLAGDKLVSASANGEVKVWSYTMNMWMEQNAFLAQQNVHQVDISDDDSYIILGGQSLAYVHEMASGALVTSFNVQDGADVWSVDFEPGGLNVVTATGTGRVVYWNMAGVLGITENEDFHVDLYPVPTADKVRIGVEHPAGNITVDILAMNGASVGGMQLPPSGGLLDLSHQADGNYVLRIRNGSGNATRIITKNSAQ
jgi:WD40 repeat protein